MNYISVAMAIFSVIAAADRIFGNRLGLGKEFERGIMLLGTMALSMIGMIVIAPAIAKLMNPVIGIFSDTLRIDPSIIPAVLFANDMGGAPLAVKIAQNDAVGMFNGLVVASMMGATVSFTIPFSLGVVGKERHRELFLGILCGIVTIPVGCFVSGVMMSIPIGTLLYNLLPLIIFSVLIACGIMFFPSVCIKIFNIFAIFIKTVITIGLSLGIVRFLTGFEVIKGLGTLEEGCAVCLNASAVMTGAFPMVYILSKLLTKPLRAVSSKININETSAMGIVSSLATSATTFEMMNRMDKKGTVLNAAFAVSGAFVFAGHLAFTLAFNAKYVVCVIVGKLVSGILALVAANFVCAGTKLH